MYQVDDAIREIAGKVGAVISAAVFAQPSRDEDFWIAVGERELNIRIGLVIAQQHVEAGFALLDQIVLKSEGLVLVVDQDVVEVDGFAHERSGFGVGLRGFEEIGAGARAEIFDIAARWAAVSPLL